MIALILGGAPTVWSEVEAAQALINRAHVVVAANQAGVEYSGHLTAWVSLHGDLLPGWLAQRAAAGRNADCRTFTPAETPERWPGSSGLYALQVALFDMGASGAILCGIPQDNGAGSLTGDAYWNGGADYRNAFRRALPEIGGRVRSLGGWTQSLFGAPTRQWADAIIPARPLGVTASEQMRTPMYFVKNTGPTEATFWHADVQTGERKLARLAPGEGAPFNIDPNQKAFQSGDLKVTPAREPSLKKAAATRKAAAKPKPTPKPKAPVPTIPAEPEA